MQPRWLASRVRGKKILHVGFLGEYAKYLELGLDHWLFEQLRQVSGELQGLDIDSAGVESLRQRGYSHLHIGNAENFDLGEPFDLVFAGDLIEHLNNPGLFLGSVGRHLAKGKDLILTTPNPYGFNLVLKAFFGQEGAAIYPEHVAYFHELHLRELLSRHGFKVTRVIYWTPIPPHGCGAGMARLKCFIIHAAGLLQPHLHGSLFIEATRV